jgi:hypothetical protein
MGVRVVDLRAKAQPVAKELISMGFNMVDIISLGVLLLRGKDANEVGGLIKAMNAAADKFPQTGGVGEDLTSLWEKMKSVVSKMSDAEFHLLRPEIQATTCEIRRQLALLRDAEDAIASLEARIEERTGKRGRRIAGK